ncbi:MAG: hypothetical protein ACJ8AT_06100 [Hyalangium sp.]|uniref:hypothetical protein n=1 Tax=Hyalangium sp. TaxID=2028555 RepID=UPI00389B0AFB
MSRRTSVLLVAAWVAMPGLALAEVELTPEKIAEIHRDEQAAKAKVNAAHGHKDPSEMTNEERAQAIQDEQAAALAVMEKHGVSDKEYSRHVAQMSLEEREAVSKAEKKLEAAAKEKAAKEAAQGKEEEPKAPEDIPIQQGISDEHPVEMESSGDSASVVEQGLPPGEQAGDEASAADSTEAPKDEAPAAPAKKKSSKRK